MTNESWKNPWKFGGGRDGSRDRDPGRDGPGRGELGRQGERQEGARRQPGPRDAARANLTGTGNSGLPTQSAGRSMA
jgi:hypothetical protein